MLRSCPTAEIKVIERCSGHGGSWGVMKENFEVALKVGKPVAPQAMSRASALSPPNARSPAPTSPRAWSGWRTADAPRIDPCTRSRSSRAPMALPAEDQAGREFT